MKFEDLPQEIQKKMSELKHASSTIESDINDALEDAESTEDFLSRACIALESLYEESRGWYDFFHRCEENHVGDLEATVKRLNKELKKEGNETVLEEA